MEKVKKQGMENLFCPYEQVLALKELGFDEPCLGFYVGKDKEVFMSSNDFNAPFQFRLDSKTTFVAPTFSQAFRWFRQKYNLFGCIDLHISTPIHWYIRIDNIIKNDYVYHSEDENLKFDTYEEAEIECLKKLIEIVKEKK